MMLEENHRLSSRFPDASGSLLSSDGGHLYAEDASILASGGLNLQALAGFMIGAEPFPWQYHCFAILATLLGNSFVTLGLMIQKISHQNDKKEPPERYYFLSSTWLLGLLVFFVGHGTCWIGLALGAQTVLSCLNCWTILLTCMFAPCMLGESLSRWKMLTISVLVFGCALVVIHGSREYHKLTREKMHQDVTGSIFLGLTISSFLAALLLTQAPISVGRQTPNAVVFKLCFFAALGGCYASLSSKTISGLMFTSLYHHEKQEMCLDFWILAVLFLGFAGWNLHFLNMALAQGEAVFVIPVYEAMSILGQVILGGFYFDEFHGLSMLRLCYFCLGVGCVLIGVILGNVKTPKLQEEGMSSEYSLDVFDEGPLSAA